MSNIFCGNCAYAKGNKPKLTWNGPISIIKWKTKIYCHRKPGSPIMQKFNFTGEGCPEWKSDERKEYKEFEIYLSENFE